MSNNIEFTRCFVKHILINCRKYDWTIQGFGMLRLNLEDDWRLHIWNSMHRIQNVTLMHDHPWNFNSLIVHGVLRNHRFTVEAAGARPATHIMRTIKPGMGLVPVGEETGVIIHKRASERYQAGDTYTQYAAEVHISEPEDNCITLVKRERSGKPDLANTFYPVGSHWVSAEPYMAPQKVVSDICGQALRSMEYD